MLRPLTPADEDRRIAALRELALLDTPPEERFDRLTRLAATVLDCPIAVVSLVDTQRQWFKSCQGLDARETPRDISFCGHAILDDAALVVPDATTDERFHDNPLVCGTPEIRFYAGQPLHSPDGSRVGTLCVIDRRPRQPTPTQMLALGDLARLVESEMAQIELTHALKARRLGEARLERYARELDAIFNLTPDGFIAFDEHGQRTYANEALRTLVGAEVAASGELAQFELLLAGCSRPATIRRAAGSAPRSDAVELELDGPPRRILQRLDRAVTTQDGRHLGTVVFLCDITQEREIDRMKTEFLSIAAHELRTPMASIHGFAELLLKRDYDTETRRDLLATIYRQSTNLTHLINELLDIARIEARAGTDFHIAAQPLPALLQHAIDTAQPPDQPSRIALELPGVLPQAIVDGEKFSQALVNVLTNALKYSAADAPVRVSVSLPERAAAQLLGVVVRDEGIGMTPEQRERICERFYRADPAGKTPGAGLGMSLVKEIIELHHGRVEISSAPQRGTTVTLWVPCEPLVP